MILYASECVIIVHNYLIAFNVYVQLYIFIANAILNENDRDYI